MAYNQDHLEAHLKPLSEVSSYTIERGDPDPRGYTVVAGDGRRVGEVNDLIIDTEAMKVRYLVIDVNDDASTDRSVLIPVSDVDVRSDARQVVARSYSGSERSYRGSASAALGSGEYDRAGEDEQERSRLTRAEEELHIGKREVSRGEVRVGKHVETEHVSEPVTRRREEVVIERRPVEAGARADASIRDDEVRIPLMEEEVVVDKRAVVKEELVVGKRVVEERDTVEADVRREEFDIENPDTTSATRGRRSNH